MPTTSSKGEAGECLASAFLSRNGFKILDRNFRSVFGELDIVASKNSYLYFIEVKTRWNLKYGFPEESVNIVKLKRIKKTIEYYNKVKNIRSEKYKLLVVSQIISGNRVIYQKIITVD